MTPERERLIRGTTHLAPLATDTYRGFPYAEVFSAATLSSDLSAEAQILP